MTVGDSVTIELGEVPGTFSALPRILFGRKGTLLRDGQSVPRIEARCAGAMPDRARLRAYREVCGFPDGEHLPVTFPHVQAHALHMSVLAHPRFPLSLLGLVHVRNSVVQYRPIRTKELVDWQCLVEGHTETDRGQEIELRTYARCGDELVWEETSTMLARRRGGGPKPKRARAAAAEALPGAQITSFAAPGDIGRRYARVSGDINPIHLTRLTARAFGFPTAIAHGMWSLGRIAAELGGQWPNGKSRFDAEFKLPVLLPAWVMLLSRPREGGVDFELRDDAGQKPHIVGRVEPLF